MALRLSGRLSRTAGLLKRPNLDDSISDCARTLRRQLYSLGYIGGLDHRKSSDRELCNPIGAALRLYPFSLVIANLYGRASNSHQCATFLQHFVMCVSCISNGLGRAVVTFAVTVTYRHEFRHLIST